MTGSRTPSHKGSRFLQDQSGTIAPIFGLLSVVLFVSAGVAVDYGRWLNARNQTQVALDAAVLAAGRTLQLNKEDTTAALAAADKFYEEHVSSRLPLENDTIEFTISLEDESITATGNAEIATPFLSLINIESMPLFSGNAASFAKAEFGVHRNLEVSIMLDVTGSMAGDRLTALKSAANDIVDILIWDDQSRFTSKIALVPFSQAINVGSNYFNAITNESTDSTLVHNTAPYQEPGLASKMFAGLKNFTRTALWSPAIAYNGSSSSTSNGNGGDDSDNNSGGGSSQNYDPCVVDRGGNATFTDEAPGPGKYFGVYDAEKQQNNWTKDMACRPSNVTVQPLTNNKTALKDKIDDLVADGYTAGHLGTAFTWYMLSPNWSSVWPSDSTPATYTDKDTKKVAILMSDGDYNTWYNSNSKGNSTEQAADLCVNMKDTGITVYAIGFELAEGSSAETVLQGCATDASKYFDADNGSELEQAFRDIGIQLSALYLSQ
jgi:Flp pilus assembly protein TadG